VLVGTRSIRPPRRLARYAAPIVHTARSDEWSGRARSYGSLARRGLATALAGGSLWSNRSRLSVLSDRSVGSVASSMSLFSAGSFLSIGSAGSILSIGSSGSILSIGSSGSILSIGAAGGFFEIRGRRRGRDEVPSDDVVPDRPRLIS
jgi:hypothetical protein